MQGNLVIVTKDRQGLVADILYILSHSHMHAEQVAGVVHGEDAVVSIIVKEPSKAKMLLENNGYSVTYSDNTVVATVQNGSDEKAKMFSQLATSKVKITDFKEIANLDTHSVFALTVDKVQKAKRILSQNLLSNFDLVSLPVA